MKASVASTYLYNIIIIFIVVIFAFIMGTIIYYRSFKVNKNILSIIEKYEGYNDFARDEIEIQMASIGYNIPNNGDTCPNKNGVSPFPYNGSYRYCVYYFEEPDSYYYSYGVITYISIDIPMFSIFIRIPVYSKSNNIYRFS